MFVRASISHARWEAPAFEDVCVLETVGAVGAAEGDGLVGSVTGAEVRDHGSGAMVEDGQAGSALTPAQGADAELSPDPEEDGSSSEDDAGWWETGAQVAILALRCGAFSHW